MSTYPTAIPWSPEDDLVMGEFLATEFIPPPLSPTITIRGLDRPFPLSPEDTFALVSARGRLHHWLTQQVMTDAYRSLGTKAKRAFLRDEYARTDQDAIRGLYSVPEFRDRLDRFKRGGT